MRIFSRCCCHRQVMTPYDQEFNINFRSRSIFHWTSTSCCGRMNKCGNMFGMPFWGGYNRFMIRPFYNPFFGIMNIFNSFFNCLWSFGLGRFAATQRFPSSIYTQNSTEHRQRDIDIQEVSSTDSDVVSDNNTGNDVSPKRSPTVSPQNQDGNTTKIEIDDDIQTGDEASDEKIKQAVEVVARDAMEKYLKNGTLTPKEILPTRADIYIRKVSIQPVFRRKTGAQNDYFNQNGDIVRVQDGTKLSITFEYKNKTYHINTVADKVSEKLTPKTVIEKYSGSS